MYQYNRICQNLGNQLSFQKFLEKNISNSFNSSSVLLNFDCTVADSFVSKAELFDHTFPGISVLTSSGHIPSAQHLPILFCMIWNSLGRTFSVPCLARILRRLIEPRQLIILPFKTASLLMHYHQTLAPHPASLNYPTRLALTASKMSFNLALFF